MHPHEQEELEFSMHRQSEVQNCFEEAGHYMRAIQPTEHGKGDFLVFLHYPYYCRATDAYVGQYVAAIWHERTPEEARERAEVLSEQIDPYEDRISFNF